MPIGVTDRAHGRVLHHRHVAGANGGNHRIDEHARVDGVITADHVAGADLVRECGHDAAHLVAIEQAVRQGDAVVGHGSQRREVVLANGRILERHHELRPKGDVDAQAAEQRHCFVVAQVQLGECHATGDVPFLRRRAGEVHPPAEHAGQRARVHAQGTGGIVQRGQRRLHCAGCGEWFQQRGAHETRVALGRAAPEHLTVDDRHSGAAIAHDQRCGEADQASTDDHD